ncbi:MAG: hypothetical protein IIT61_08535, partial [Bacteroidales bacterium]|nr:hypothetical protein [Bacteroidales bacterium]
MRVQQLTDGLHGYMQSPRIALFPQLVPANAEAFPGDCPWSCFVNLENWNPNQERETAFLESGMNGADIPRLTVS